MLSPSVAGSWCAEATLENNLGLARNSEWYPTGLGGIGSVVGDEVAELVGGVHALALLAATQAHAHAAALPAGVLAHPFDDKTAIVSAEEEHTLYVTSGGVVNAVTRQMPRLISRRLTARLRPARHLTFVVPLCRAATHPDKQALHRQRPEGQSRRTASCTKFLPRLRNGARGNRSGNSSR